MDQMIPLAVWIAIGGAGFVGGLLGLALTKRRMATTPTLGPLPTQPVPQPSHHALADAGPAMAAR